MSHTKIRLRVMAWTGVPQMQLERLREGDVDFKNAQIYLRPRRKGRGTKGTGLDLLPPAVDALRDYARENLWGRGFSRDSMRATWKRAIKRTIERAARRAAETGDSTEFDLLLKHIRKDCRPYDLRHSFLTEAYKLTGDLRAVAHLGQHANLSTTKRYTEAAVPERAAAAIAKMAAQWRSAPPSSEPKL